MPIYDFKCKCGFEFNKRVAMGTKECVCPKCGEKSKKVLSKSFGIAFKGSGFHVNDYRR